MDLGDLRDDSGRPDSGSEGFGEAWGAESDADGARRGTWGKT